MQAAAYQPQASQGLSHPKISHVLLPFPWDPHNGLGLLSTLVTITHLPFKAPRKFERKGGQVVPLLGHMAQSHKRLFLMQLQIAATQRSMQPNNKAVCNCSVITEALVWKMTVTCGIPATEMIPLLLLYYQSKANVSVVGISRAAIIFQATESFAFKSCWRTLFFFMKKTKPFNFPNNRKLSFSSKENQSSLLSKKWRALLLKIALLRWKQVATAHWIWSCFLVPVTISSLVLG